MTILRKMFVVLGLALIACTARAHDAKDEGFGQLSIDEVQALVAKGEVSVFDNNSKDRWAEGHVPTATWVDFMNVKKGDLPQDQSRKLVFYCSNEH
jgi:hypothetical protein